MSKKTTTILLVTVGLFGLAGSVMATPPPPTVPDGGSSALLLTIACAGTIAVRSIFSKKK